MGRQLTPTQMELLAKGPQDNFLTLPSSSFRKSRHRKQLQGEETDSILDKGARELPREVSDCERDCWTIELFLRGSATSSQTHEQQILEKLVFLSEHGLIDSVQTRIWPDRIGIEPEKTACMELIEIYNGFEEWAREHEISIHPPFTIREYSSSITQDRGKVLITPVMFLTVYKNGEMVGMYPCDNDGTMITIDTWVSRISSEELPVSTKDRSLQTVPNSS